MRQYLPMTGKDDPHQDPTGNYYETMIFKLQELITLSKTNNRLTSDSNPHR